MMRNKKYFIRYFILFFIVHIIWLVTFFPGIITYDSCGQLLMCIWGGYNDHHPVISSLIMYAFLLIGKSLFHSDNVGIFLFILFQVLIQSFAFSCVMILFRRKLSHAFFGIFSLLFFCLFPLCGMMSVIFCKDTLYAVFALLCFVLTQVLYCSEANKPAPSFIYAVLWALSLVGLCIFRHEGKIIVVAILTLLFISYPSKRALTVKGLAAVISILVINSAIICVMDVSKGSVREKLSLPILFTAQYYNRYPADLSEEDDRILRSVFDISDISELTYYTDLDISDEIKEKMIYAPDRHALIEYCFLVLKDSVRHPGLFFEVVWKHSSGYFLPAKEKFEEADSFLYILGGEERIDEYLKIGFGSNKTLRNTLRNYVCFWDDNPVLGILFNPGLYTWLMIIEMAVLIICRKAKKVLWYLPMLLTLAILVLSPLNGSLRYSLPLIYTMPVYLELAYSQFASIFTKRKSSVS